MTTVQKRSLHRAAIAAVLVMAATVAGCSSESQTEKKGQKHSASTSELPPAQVIQPQTGEDHHELRLTFGQPVTFNREGVSLTVVPHSWGKISSTPPGVGGTPFDCGLWWEVKETWIIEVKPDTTWIGWRREFQGLFGLFDEEKDSQYGFYKNVAIPAFGEDTKNLDKQLADAYQKWDRTAPFHFEESGSQYLALCTINTGGEGSSTSAQFVPHQKPLTSLELRLPEAQGQNPRSWPTYAIWTP